MIAKSAVAILRRTSHCGETARFPPPPPFFFGGTQHPLLHSQRRTRMYIQGSTSYDFFGSLKKRGHVERRTSFDFFGSQRKTRICTGKHKGRLFWFTKKRGYVQRRTSFDFFWFKNIDENMYREAYMSYDYLGSQRKTRLYTEKHEFQHFYALSARFFLAHVMHRVAMYKGSSEAKTEI